MANWSLDSVDWKQFDPSAVEPDLLALAKTAALVEFNGADYTDYLCHVFHDDPQFQRAARNWGSEEIRHGAALGRWAELADPDFKFQYAVAKFRAGYRIPVNADISVRGSRSGELLARCMVEMGTSAYYAALRDQSREPVLRQICDFIHGDEIRHYRLFHHYLQRYLKREPLGLVQRLKVGLGRIAEADDDELSFAFHCGNGLPEPYHRETASREYLRRAFSVYRLPHVRHAVAFSCRAMGLPLPGALQPPLARLLAWRIRRVATFQVERANG